MNKTIFVLFALSLSLLPTAAGAEESVPAVHCVLPSFKVYMPGIVGADSSSVQSQTSPSASSAANPRADFNNDGCADLAVGARKSMQAGLEKGVVEIFYGSDDGLAHYQPQILIDSGTPGQWFGWALATGNFNGDAYDDLAVAETGAWVDGIANAGVVHIYYGSDRGLEARNSTVLHQNSPGVPGGAEVNDRFGTSLAVGSFNADQFQDLAVGIPREDIGTVADAGYVIILYGSANGLTGSGAKGFTQDTSGVPGKVETGAFFGFSLVAADFGLSSREDLAIGAPYKDVELLGRNEGAVYLLYGTANGLSAADAHELTQQSYGVGGSPENDDHFGYALAAGDFDRNFTYDLAVGTPGEDVSFKEDAGRIDVFYGRPDKTLPSAGSDDYYQGTGKIPQSPEEGDQFGFSLVAGKFDQNGFWDLAVGSPYETINSGENSGGVTVLFGTSDGLDDEGALFFVDISYKEGVFGYALSAGDYFGDGYYELVVGMPLISGNRGVAMIYDLRNQSRSYITGLTGNFVPDVEVIDFAASLP